MNGHSRPTSMCLRCGQMVVEVQQHAAAGDQNGRMQGVDAVQPDRRGREPEGEAAAAGGDAADQARRAREWRACRGSAPDIIRSAQIEDEDEADREHRGEADRQHGHASSRGNRRTRPRARAGRASCGGRARRRCRPRAKSTSGVARQRQERVERIGAVERGGERQEMQRQEDRKRDAGQPMQHGGDESPAACARRASCRLYTAIDGAQAEHQQQQREQRQREVERAAAPRASIRATRCAGRSAHGSRPRSRTAP